MDQPARLIAHVDMDAFYVSVEVLDDPGLAGRPVIVGGDGRRGVVASASYPARRQGVRSAMPTIEARRLCPQAVFLPPRMARYVQLSRQVMAALETFAPVVEVASIDEAFLDLTGTGQIHGPPEQAGQRLKDLVRQATGLVCSVGLAANRLVAKIASDRSKPDGLLVVAAGHEAAFLAGLPVGRLPGVGPKLQERLESLGLNTIGQLVALGEEGLVRRLGDGGRWLHRMALGRDDTPVTADRGDPKSISAEQTLEENLTRPEQMIPLLAEQALEVAGRLRRQGLTARTVTLKLKHADFRLATRSRTLESATDQTGLILQTALELLHAYGRQGPVRLIGLGLSHLERPAAGQPGLFDPPADQDRRRRADQALDEIIGRFGPGAIKLGASLVKPE